MKHTPIIVAREVLDYESPDHAPIYVTSWPEHVRVPRYNGDATYHPFQSIEAALAAWPDADIDYASIDLLGPLARDRWLENRPE